MKAWLDENYPILACLFIVLIGVVIIAMSPATIVVAAPPADPDVYICPQVAQANGIEVYRCLDEQTGTVMYVNQLGFMMPEPY